MKKRIAYYWKIKHMLKAGAREHSHLAKSVVSTNSHLALMSSHVVLHSLPHYLSCLASWLTLGWRRYFLLATPLESGLASV